MNLADTLTDMELLLLCCRKDCDFKDRIKKATQGHEITTILHEARNRLRLTGTL